MSKRKPNNKENIHNKAIKYRIYPTEQQKELLSKTFGCCRFIYNQMLSIQKELYNTEKKHLSKFDANNMCNKEIKQKFSFLKEIDKFAITNSIYNLCDAYDNFLSKKSGYPKYKSKHKSRKSYTTNITGENIAIGENYVKLPKLKKVKAKIHRIAPNDWKIKSATVSQSSNGRYYVSILYEYEKIVTPVTINKDNVVGLDYSTPNLYVDSNGISPTDILKYYKLSAPKLAKEQRKLSKKVVGSNNWKKQKQKVNNIHCKIANQRKDSLHKISTAIIKQFDAIVIEDISIKEQLQGRKYKNYRKSTLDNGWYFFTQMLEYKLNDRGKKLIKIDKYYPSSQICSRCGNINTTINNDSIRKWVCPYCGTSHNRDINSAINIKNEGLRILGIA